MRLLVTGATGRIGPHIVASLKVLGHSIHVLLSERYDKVPKALQGSVDEVTHGSILSCEDWAKGLQSVDAVVHLAGRSGDSDDAFDVNVSSTRALAAAVAVVGTRRIVFASTNCVLGHCFRPKNNPLSVNYLPIDERHPLSSYSDYGVSKRCSEEVLAATGNRFGTVVRALRFAWMLTDRDCRDGVWRSLPSHIQSSSFWAYLHLDDAARAIQASLTDDHRSAFEAMYISAADTFSDRSSAELAAEYYGYLDEEYRLLEGYSSFFSNRHASDVIGFTPETSWRQF